MAKSDYWIEEIFSVSYDAQSDLIILETSIGTMELKPRKKKDKEMAEQIAETLNHYVESS